MKLLRCLVMLLLGLSLAIAVWAEEGVEETVKLRDAAAMKGSLLMKEMTRLGEVQGEFGATLLFESMVVTFPDQPARTVRGVKITMSSSLPGGEQSTSLISDDEDEEATTVYIYLDEDELIGLSHAIPTMLEIVGKWEGTKNEKEICYTTRDDLTVSITNDSNGVMTSIYGYDGDSALALLKSPEHLLTVKGFFDKTTKQFSNGR